jgi:hypothetical protein
MQTKNKKKQPALKAYHPNEEAHKVVTGKIRLSYAHLFEPWTGDNGEAKYSAAVLIPKSDESTLSAIEEAVAAAIEKGKSRLATNGKVPKNLKTPLRDGDEERSEQEEYEKMYFLNASNKRRPGLIDRVYVDGEPVDITEPYDVDGKPTLYSGCYARVALTFFAFNTNGNRGVACSLDHVQKLADGEPLDGSSSASDVFDELDDDGDDELD